MPSKKLRVKYPGWLGKPIPRPGDIMEVSQLLDANAYDRWLLREQDRALVKLLSFYDIPSEWSPADRWYALAWRLALDHVPAMCVRLTRGPGRPTTARRNPLGHDLARKKRGAPKKWDDELLQALVARVDKIKAEAAATGQRLSDNAALEEFLKEKARHQGMAELKVSRKIKSKPFTRWRKQLQIARKKFPQNSTT